MSTPNELTELKERFPNFFKKPEIHDSVFLAPGSQVMGDVILGEESSVWYNTVLRGDVNAIRIGDRTNIQDLTMVHESYQVCPCEVGNDVTIGHSVILHSCRIGHHCLIGMGSQILDEAEIGDWVLLGAGSLVTPGTKIPSGSKALGRPARVVGEISDKERKWIEWSSAHYVALAKTHRLKGA